MSNVKDEEVKNSILEAAKIVFQKWGLNKATMEDIAKEAGKGKSTLYYYFKSKDEIFEVLSVTEMNNVIAKARAMLSTEKTVKDKLKKYITLVLGEIKTTISINPLVRGDIKGNKVFIESLRKKMDVFESQVIAELLEEGVAAGEFTFISKEKLSKAANVLVGMIRGLEVYLFVDNDDYEAIDIATKIISGGI
jgi:AcrR family transcriptional regulator